MKKLKDLTQNERKVLIKNGVLLGTGIVGGCLIGRIIYRKGKFDTIYRIAKDIAYAETIYPAEVKAFNKCMNELAGIEIHHF